jgi:hypothetical protein
MLRLAAVSLSLLVSFASLATTPETAPAGAGDVAKDTDNAAVVVAKDGGAPDAPETPDTKSMKAIVHLKLVGPLAMNEEKRSRFSRARMPAQERRVRVIDAKAKTDKAGNAFHAFAVDARHGFMHDEDADGWRTDTIVGCVYPQSGKVFVKMGEGFRPGEAMLGKKGKGASAKVCEAATSTQVASKG